MTAGFGKRWQLTWFHVDELWVTDAVARPSGEQNTECLSPPPLPLSLLLSVSSIALWRVDEQTRSFRMGVRVQLCLLSAELQWITERPWWPTDHRHSLKQLLSIVALQRLPVTVRSPTSNFLPRRTEMTFCKAGLWSTWGPRVPRTAPYRAPLSLTLTVEECLSADHSCLHSSNMAEKVMFITSLHISLKGNPLKSLQQ